MYVKLYYCPALLSCCVAVCSADVTLRVQYTVYTIQHSLYTTNTIHYPLYGLW